MISTRSRQDRTALPPVPIGTVRAANLAGLPSVLKQAGVCLDTLLDAAGLPRGLLDHPENIVEIDKGARLLALASEQARCPHLGLLCGHAFRPETIGVVGKLAQNAVDVGSALRGLILNLHLNGHAFVPLMTTASDTVEFGLRPAVELTDKTGIVVDLGIAAAFAILRSLCGPQWKPIDVLLVRRAPANRQPYDRLFGVPVRFGSDSNGIVFATAWLDRPVHGANAAKRQVLERELAVMAQRQRLPAATLARRSLIACIARGEASVEAVAGAMGLHPRSLNRRLAQEGTSVFELMKEVRFQIARDLLANTSLSITEISTTLLYANTGAFSRAFHLWADKSPSDWRVQHAASASLRRGSAI